MAPRRNIVQGGLANDAVRVADEEQIEHVLLVVDLEVLQVRELNTSFGVFVHFHFGQVLQFPVVGVLVQQVVPDVVVDFHVRH